MNRNANSVAAWLGLALAVVNMAGAQDAGTASEPLPEDEYEFALSPEDRISIEQDTCRAWHQRGIGSARAFEQYDHKRATVSFECESHDAYRKYPLHGVGDCWRTELVWNCRDRGLSIDLHFGRDKFTVSIGHIPPQTAVEIVTFLRKSRWNGEPVKKMFVEWMTLFPVENGVGRYSLEVESENRIVDFVVEQTCARKRCRFRLVDMAQANFS